MSDLPDFYAPVDFALQSLAEVIVRPKYGTRGMMDVIAPIDANVVNTIATVTGKGVIYGGALCVQGIASQKLDLVGSQLDGGGQYFCPTWEDMLKFGLRAKHGATWQPDCYDEINFRYASSLSFGITFETEFKILYSELSGNTPTLVLKILYAVL